jgi:hypothetical protein
MSDKMTTRKILSFRRKPESSDVKGFSKVREESLDADRVRHDGLHKTRK